MLMHIKICVSHNNNSRKETEIGEGVRGAWEDLEGRKGRRKII